MNVGRYLRGEDRHVGTARTTQPQPPQRTEPVIDKSAAIRIATVLGWTPPRTWVGLTDDDEIDWEEGGNLKDLVKAIEAKLKDKNGYAVEKNT